MALTLLATASNASSTPTVIIQLSWIGCGAFAFPMFPVGFYVELRKHSGIPAVWTWNGSVAGPPFNSGTALGAPVSVNTASTLGGLQSSIAPVTVGVPGDGYTVQTLVPPVGLGQLNGFNVFTLDNGVGGTFLGPGDYELWWDTFGDAITSGGMSGSLTMIDGGATASAFWKDLVLTTETF